MPSHLAVVWVGYDDNRHLDLTGSAGAIAGVGCPDGESASHRSAADNAGTHIELQSIDYDTGALTRPGCGGPVTIPIP